ncbi:alpha/beta hydrolase [Herpetosiphon sp. NSE202]|uniref:alpha/beta hydrolase n=1 Tax=Herpetosiphon sp. NSE202 TaxID=3351349 RepID=UPI003643A3D8
MTSNTLEHRCYQPKTLLYQRPLLLLHGAWHGAWCWDNAAHDFAERGFAVHTLSLRGHGRSSMPRYFNTVGLNHYIDDLLALVATLKPAPIVVGHSLGGYILQHAVMQHPLPAAILLASMPQTGPLGFTLRTMRTQPSVLLRAFATADGYGFVRTPALAKYLFLRDNASAAQTQAIHSQLGSESLRVLLDALMHKPKPSQIKTPIMVIAAERDRVFTLAEQRSLANAYQAPLIIVPQAAHDLMFDPAWPLVADAIEGWASRHQTSLFDQPTP